MDDGVKVAEEINKYFVEIGTSNTLNIAYPSNVLLNKVVSSPSNLIFIVFFLILQNKK